MKYILWGIVIAAGLYSLHRLALWAEQRGWIYYRRSHGSSGTLGNAMLEVQAMIEPSKRHILEERVKESAEAQKSGDPPEAGRNRGPTKK